MDFVKMEGLGNDFVVLAGPKEVRPEDVVLWCDRRRGIGADGVLVISPLSADAVRMEYWNADGAAAEMCGNGLRCAARFARDRGWVMSDTFAVETAIGARPVELLSDGSIRAFLGTPQGSGEPFEAAGYEVRPLSMGNPHAVILVEDCSTEPVAEVGPVIETDPRFREGANVEFVTVTGRTTLALRVWERGVGETLACGTGAAAAVVVANEQGLTDTTVTTHLPGGPLRVEIRPDGAWIEGPATVVYHGRFETPD